MRKQMLTAALCTMALLSHACGTHSPRKDGNQLKSLGNGACQQPSGLIWQEGTSLPFDNWNEASFYAENLVLAGYADWRLPSRDELYTLCNLHELQQMGDCRMELRNNYWSGRQPEEGEVGHWEAYPLCGGTDFKYIESQKGVVRAVRP